MTSCERCGARLAVREIAGRMVAAPCSHCGRESRPLTPWQHGVLEHVVGQLERATRPAGHVHVNGVQAANIVFDEYREPLGKTDHLAALHLRSELGL